MQKGSGRACHQRTLLTPNEERQMLHLSDPVQKQTHVQLQVHAHEELTFEN
jgi:hypothetical protein